MRAALTKAETSYPGLAYDLVIGILRRGDITVNMNESILRLQGELSDNDGSSPSVHFFIYFYFIKYFLVVEYRLNRSEDAFQELNKKSATLKKILSRIPDEITDRKTFLEIIK